MAEANLGREKLEEEVAFLRQKLAEETEAKKHIQDNLKRVFMRGVCQLNGGLSARWSIVFLHFAPRKLGWSV